MLAELASMVEQVIEPAGYKLAIVLVVVGLVDYKQVVMEVNTHSGEHSEVSIKFKGSKVA